MITERLKKSDEKASLEDLLYKWNGDALCGFGYDCCGFARRTAYQLPLQNHAGRHHSTSQWWLWALQQCGRKSESIARCAGTLMTAFTAVSATRFRCCKRRFITDTRYFWIGCNQFPPCNYEVPLLIRTMYSLELGFYVQVSVTNPLPLHVALHRIATSDSAFFAGCAVFDPLGGSTQGLLGKLCSPPGHNRPHCILLPSQVRPSPVIHRTHYLAQSVTAAEVMHATHAAS